MLSRLFIFGLVCSLATAYAEENPLLTPTDPLAPKEATLETQNINQATLAQLPFANRQDFDDAAKGFISTTPELQIKSPEGRLIWSLTDYNFLKSDKVPDTVNPSLWRQAQLNMNNGLYKVVDGIYQIRGFDLSNMDIIEGKTGLIIIDPLISKETAQAGLELYYMFRPKKPVVAVIYTHSHVDHYGGVRGVVSDKDMKEGKVKIYAPEGFLEAAVSENVYAGNAMSRRAIYMYGALLPKNERGQVDSALGKTTSLGEVTLIPPTDVIKNDGEKRVIDGVEIVFQLAANTEAPAEMLMYFPQYNALCMAEDATHTLHNLYTLRGAQVRDAAAWWKTINTAIQNFGDKTDVVFAQHHWPTWGRDNIIPFLEKQRDAYKYIHDQTLHLMNQGYTMTEVGNMMKLPDSLSNEWYNQGYYGSVSHDAKAVYQRYLGWYDSNPAHLDKLSPIEAGQHYVDMMGGPSALLKKAHEYYKKGEYRWVAQVTNHLVVSHPKNNEARALQADALEQLGYQTANATWRNEYLVAAYELRHGVPHMDGTTTDSPDTVHAMPMEMIFDFLGIRLNSERAEGKKLAVNINVTDTKEQYALGLKNSVLIYTPRKRNPSADATLYVTRAAFDDILLKQKTIEGAIKDKSLSIEGDREKFKELMSLFDTFPTMFNIITSNAPVPAPKSIALSKA